MDALNGKRIVITRPRAQAEELSEKLMALGAHSIIFPTITIAPADDMPAIDEAIAVLDRFDWVIFTSVNGVSAFWERLTVGGKDARAFAGVHVAAIGPATRQALIEHGVQPDFIPDEYVAERIIDGLGDVSGRSILLPRADIARETLARELERRGATVRELAVYLTLPALPDAQALAELQRGVAVITFTSSSTVHNFVALTRGIDYGDPLIACIGPITAATARELGLHVNVVAHVYTVDGLIDALRQIPFDEVLSSEA